MQVEEIADELEFQHGGAYTREQYSVWAHMIDMRKHESRDIPQDKPFFKGSKGKKKNTSSDPCSSSTDPLEISPGISSGSVELLQGSDEVFFFFPLDPLKKGLSAHTMYGSTREVALSTGEGYHQ